MARNYSNGAAVTERRQFRANNDAGVARRTSATAGKKEEIFPYRLRSRVLLKIHVYVYT